MPQVNSRLKTSQLLLTHISDQFGPFATQNIPATVSEAPYILDRLLMKQTSRKIKEQHADTGGFTDHVFAITSLLAFRSFHAYGTRPQNGIPNRTFRGRHGLRPQADLCNKADIACSPDTGAQWTS
jgi:hypothetical protein